MVLALRTLLRPLGPVVIREVLAIVRLLLEARERRVREDCAEVREEKGAAVLVLSYEDTVDLASAAEVACKSGEGTSGRFTVRLAHLSLTGTALLRPSLGFAGPRRSRTVRR